MRGGSEIGHAVQFLTEKSKLRLLVHQQALDGVA